MTLMTMIAMITLDGYGTPDGHDYLNRLNRYDNHGNQGN